jgi:hypothetical protein
MMKDGCWMMDDDGGNSFSFSLDLGTEALASTGATEHWRE